MRLSGVHSINPNILSVGSKSSSAKISRENSAVLNFDRRFDTFTMVGTEKNKDFEKTAADRSLAVSDLIRKLSDFSDEEKAEIITASYLEMKKILKSTEDNIEINIGVFERLKDERSYYNSLLDSGGELSDRGKYKLYMFNKGETVSIDNIEKALSKTQRQIDGFSEPMNDFELKCNKAFYRIYNQSAANLSALIGISLDSLTIEDGAFNLNLEELTEDNYIQKATEQLNTVRECSKQLTEVINEYKNSDRLLREKMNDPLGALKKVEEMANTPIAKILREFHKALNLSVEYDEKMKILT